MNRRLAVDTRADSSTLGALLAEMQSGLAAAGVEAADREARWLIQHGLGLTGSRHLLDETRRVDADGLAQVRTLLLRRMAREPLQYILGTQEFCGLEFEVNPDVLIPRPETELLAQEVIRRLPQSGRSTVVDVGTGSGCLAVTLARAVPSAMIVATDLSPEALKMAKRNARRHGVDAKISWLEGDLLAPVSEVCDQHTVTAIMANPPYIRESEWSSLQPEVGRYEPRTALVAGTRGTEIHERLLVEAIAYLAPGGFLAMEIGQGQSNDLRRVIARMTAYERVEVVADEAEIDRIMIIQRAT
jgi:release factor glutamine methyltransferase